TQSLVTTYVLFCFTNFVDIDLIIPFRSTLYPRRIECGTFKKWRVDARDRAHAFWIVECHRPYDHTTPIMPDKHRRLLLQDIEKPDHISTNVFHSVVFDPWRSSRL